MLDKIKKHYNGNIKGKHFALWGLAFKPNTDDVREAPALALIEALLSDGATVSAYDPEAMNNAKLVLGDAVQFAQGQYDALAGANALIIATEWNEFRTPDFNRIASSLTEKVIFDGRNLYDVESMKKLGFVYGSVGR